MAARVPPILVPLLISAFLWGLLFQSIPPADQNFPLNDDWAFSRSVLAFARGEGIHYGNWVAMPQLGQWLWACPFIWGLGESHFALRFSTVLLSWLGLWAFYDLLCQEGCSARQAAWIAATLALNPLFFLLQGTFMTDVPALSFTLAALALFTRALNSGRTVWLGVAVGVTILAVITRQNTVAIPIAVGIVLWRFPQLRWRPIWLLAVVVPLVVGVGTHL